MVPFCPVPRPCERGTGAAEPWSAPHAAECRDERLWTMRYEAGAGARALTRRGLLRDGHQIERHRHRPANEPFRALLESALRDTRTDEVVTDVVVAVP